MALAFFDRFSAHTASGTPTGAFAKFTREFYVAVTGVDPEDHSGNWPASAERRNLAADEVEVAHPIEVGVIGDTGCAVAGAALGSAP